MPTGQPSIVRCVCGCERLGPNNGRNLIHNCYTRLHREGLHTRYPRQNEVLTPHIYKLIYESVTERVQRYEEMREQGLSKNEIAIQLGVSYRTVQRYDAHLRGTKENTMGKKPNDHLADDLATSTDKEKNEEIVRQAIEDSKADDAETDKKMGK